MGASEPAPILRQVDLTSLLQDVVETELMAIGQLPIAVRFEISENLIIHADPEQLHRALSNLVRNARQALADQSQGGAIVLKAWQNQEFWFIDVVDNGLGLPEKAKVHLFKPFQGTATWGIRIGLNHSSRTDAWAWGQRRVLRGKSARSLFPAYVTKVGPR